MYGVSPTQTSWSKTTTLFLRRKGEANKLSKPTGFGADRSLFLSSYISQADKVDRILEWEEDLEFCIW